MRALLTVLGAAMRLTLRLLEREHPTRVFIGGRLSESMPAVERSLDSGATSNWLGEAVVGSSLLFSFWTVFDYLFDSMVGPLELGQTLAGVLLG